MPCSSKRTTYRQTSADRSLRSRRADARSSAELSQESAQDVPIAATPVRASRIPCPIITPTMRAATSPSCAPMRNCYGLIYSVAIRKISARQQRVDEHYQLGVCAIGAPKKTTPKKRYVHRVKVIGTGWIIDRARDLGHGCRLARADPRGCSSC